MYPHDKPVMPDLAEIDTPLHYWLRLATRQDVIMRSLRVAVLVGTILILNNYLDRMVGPALSKADILKMGLTYLVPYCVSTYASVQSLHRGC